MRAINWKLIVFWVALWWFVYTAPTEDPLARFSAFAGDDVASWDAEFD
jgi:hypothetical protein